MIDLSQTVKTRIQSDSRTFRAKITIGQTDYTDLREFYVSSGTEAGGSISIGSTYSTRLSVKLANVARNTIVQGTKVTAHVGVKIDDDLETFDDIDDPTVYSWFQIGEFYISEADPEDEDVIITAYDGFYLTQTLYDTEYTSATTVANLVSEIATNCNFQYVSDSIMNVNYDPTVLTGLTYREVIGYLASFVGTNAVFDELGRLKFIWYSDISRTIDEDRIASPLQLGDYTYTLGTLECVVAQRELDEEGIEQTTTVKLTSGTLGKTISFPQLYMTQAQLDTIRTRMLGDGFSVRAAEVVWNMAEPDIQAGDIVTLEDEEDTFSIPVMRMQLYIDGGCYGNITSLYEADTDASSTFEGSIAIAVERQYEELATFKKVVANMIVAERIRTQQLIADDIQAAEISATQITSGSLDTSKITVSSEDGGMIISGSTQVFKDKNGTTRIILGKDANGDYNLFLFDEQGNVLLNEKGITTEGIPAETVTGEKIVITGDEGLYQELNTEGEPDEYLQTTTNSFDGANIKAKTITANKINVADLYALKATIGGWEITDVALKSRGKTGYGDNVRGVYLGSGAQVSYAFLVDENGYILTDENNNPLVYQKDISFTNSNVCMDMTGANGQYLRFDGNGNVEITGDLTAINGTKSATMTADGYTVEDNGTVLAQFGATTYIGDRATTGKRYLEIDSNSLELKKVTATSPSVTTDTIFSIGENDAQNPFESYWYDGGYFDGNPTNGTAISFISEHLPFTRFVVHVRLEDVTHIANTTFNYGTSKQVVSTIDSNVKLVYDGNNTLTFYGSSGETYSVAVEVVQTFVGVPSFALGDHLINTYPNQLIVGAYNDTGVMSANAPFIIANGTATERNNLFTVYNTGSAYLGNEYVKTFENDVLGKHVNPLDNSLEVTNSFLQSGDNVICSGLITQSKQEVRFSYILPQKFSDELICDSGGNLGAVDITDLTVIMRHCGGGYIGTSTSVSSSSIDVTSNVKSATIQGENILTIVLEYTSVWKTNSGTLTNNTPVVVNVRSLEFDWKIDDDV